MPLFYRPVLMKRVAVVTAVLVGIWIALLLGCSLLEAAVTIPSAAAFMASTKGSRRPQLQHGSTPVSRPLLVLAARRRTGSGASSMKSRRPKTQNQWKRDSRDILSMERSLIDDTSNDVSYVLGSDESGRGCVAGPVVAATCCILPLFKQEEEENLGLLLSSMLGESAATRDSKQLSPDERERIFQIIVDHPQTFAFSVAQRSHTEIDQRGNILISAMECFQESIEEVACHLLSDCEYRRTNDGDMDDSGDDDDENSLSAVEPATGWKSAYSIVDGNKTPKLSVHPPLPCRPYVNADAQVYTVALASIIAKVSHDRQAQEWDEAYPEYEFLQHKGYATKKHIEAIHRYGPCPLHRMTFQPLKGR